jgi:hypothetical protein
MNVIRNFENANRKEVNVYEETFSALHCYFAFCRLFSGGLRPVGADTAPGQRGGKTGRSCTCYGYRSTCTCACDGYRSTCGTSEVRLVII